MATTYNENGNYGISSSCCSNFPISKKGMHKNDWEFFEGLYKKTGNSAIGISCLASFNSYREAAGNSFEKEFKDLKKVGRTVSVLESMQGQFDSETNLYIKKEVAEMKLIMSHIKRPT